MTIAGGATCGYCEIGNCVIDTAPITRMKSAITQAKIGRLMKNWAMGEAFAFLAAGLAAGLGIRGQAGFTCADVTCADVTCASRPRRCRPCRPRPSPWHWL